MVFSYFYSQLIPSKFLKRDGFILVLSAGNLDEGLRGYATSIYLLKSLYYFRFLINYFIYQY